MAIWLPDLDGRDGPKYLQIVEAMAHDIASGRLAADTQLPPHRELAYQLGLSANTTSRAYAEAVRRGLLRGEVGRGSFVRSTSAPSASGAAGSLHRDSEGPVDLSQNLPLAGFAEPHIRRAMSAILDSGDLPSLLDYQKDSDLNSHLEAGLTWLEQCGVKAEADEIVITMGGQHGLLCTLMALLQPGDLLLTESLTYMPVHAMAERLGLQTATVSMDREGVVPEAFEELCRHARPSAFYLTPTLQAPTTRTLSAGRRSTVAGIADRHAVTLIEDDVFAPLKPDRPAPLSCLVPDRTVYVTSLSKAVAPGLRVGFLRAPSALVPALRQAINLSVWMTPPVTLEIASRLIDDGTVATISRQQRDTAHRRQKLARSILGDADFDADGHGMHIWLHLPDGWRADTFGAHCARNGVLIAEAHRFAPEIASAPEAVRLCLSHEVDEKRLEAGLRTIAGILDTPTIGPVLML